MQEATENVKPAISFPYLLPEVVSTVTAGVFRVPRAFVVALIERQEVRAAGTGGMLSEAAKYLRELNPDATLVISGQDYNAEAYAICGYLFRRRSRLAQTP